MDKDEVQAMAFKLVACAGEASGHFHDAVSCARKGDFDAAEDKIREGDASLISAHEAQTGLLRCEVTGEDIAFSLLLVHAQDHLMTTMLFEQVAKEFIEVYREVHRDR